MDIVLMVLVSIMLDKRCKQAKVRSFPHILRLIGYWFISETLGMMLCERLGLPILSIGNALCAIAIGGLAGYLSYRKSLAEITSINGGGPPELNG